MNSLKPESKYRLPRERADQIRAAPPAIMNLMEGSAYMVCSVRKLRALIAAGRVKSARCGAKILMRKEWLDTFLG